MVDYHEIINFSRDELLDEYCKLFDRFQDLRKSNEAGAQKIHELKRSLDTATAAQVYLSQELDQYTNSDSNAIPDELHKAQTELVEAKRKYSKLEDSFANLRQDYNLLSEENSKIIKNLQESLKRKEQIPCEEDTKKYDDYLLRIQVLEDANMDLLQKIEDFEEVSVHYTLTIAECEKNIEILKDQIECLEENLKYKRTDLEEKNQVLESTQEQLAEANTKIAMLSAAPDNDHKGNSLFAEVDDQRQAMKLLLKAQKKNYMEMKKVYNEREHEIRRLKRENISMRTELETCSSIFCNADKIYQEKLNDRVRNLLNQNEELERKLKWTQEKLKEIAAEKGVLFLDSMLTFCKKETDDLKSQLHSVRIQNATLEEHLRNSQQDMARWRFESLKSRCVLIDREYLLTEHKIDFKPANALEYNINAKDQEEAKPRILTKRRSSILENVIHRKSITPSNTPIKQELSIPQLNLIKDNEIPNNLNIKKEQKEQLNINVHLTNSASNNVEKTPEELCSSEINEATNKEVNSTNINAIESNCSLNMYKDEQQNNDDDKENHNNNANNLGDIPKLNKFTKLKATPPSPMRPSQRSLEKFNLETSAPPARSILTKQKDWLFKDSCRNVKFSSAGDTVHNLSAKSPSPKNASTSDDNSHTRKVNSKKTVKQSLSKSNIVVRHVVISSKHE